MIVTNLCLNYNRIVKYIVCCLVLLTTLISASRERVTVAFSNLPKQSNYVPFSVIVPHHVSGEFVRFVHPRNGKSAVARVISRDGNQYKTDRRLASVIGLANYENATLYIEEVY